MFMDELERLSNKRRHYAKLPTHIASRLKGDESVDGFGENDGPDSIPARDAAEAEMYERQRGTRDKTGVF